MLLSLLPLFAIITNAVNVGLKNLGASCFMNTALQALASVPAISNIILSVDSRKLDQESHRNVLLKLQTILYFLRTGDGNISMEYLRKFLQAFSVVSKHGWDNGYQHDEQEFYLSLVNVIDDHLLPEAKRDNFRALMQLIKTQTTKPPRDTDNKNIPEFLLPLNFEQDAITSLKDALDAQFSPEHLETNDGGITRQFSIKTPPPILSLYTNRTVLPGTPKNTHKVTFPQKLNIKDYKHGGTKWDISSEYELQYIAVHTGSRIDEWTLLWIQT